MDTTLLRRLAALAPAVIAVTLLFSPAALAQSTLVGAHPGSYPSPRHVTAITVKTAVRTLAAPTTLRPQGDIARSSDRVPVDTPLRLDRAS